MPGEPWSAPAPRRQLSPETSGPSEAADDDEFIDFDEGLGDRTGEHSDLLLPEEGSASQIPPDSGGGTQSPGNHDHRSLDRESIEHGTERSAANPARIVRSAREFGRAHLAVVVVVCAAMLIFATSQILRARATTVPAGRITALEGFSTPGASPLATGTSPGSVSPTPQPPVHVHVLGEVRVPGVHELPWGARVADAVKAAGGMTDGADPGELNLAATICDGCQVVIGTRASPRGEVRGPAAPQGSAAGTGGAGSASTGPAGAAASGQTAGGAGASGSKTDLNTADVTALDQLPGIGPVIAGRIVEWRNEHKRFTRIEELQEVSGIGPALYEKVKNHVTVS